MYLPVPFRLIFFVQFSYRCHNVLTFSFQVTFWNYRSIYHGMLANREYYNFQIFFAPPLPDEILPNIRSFHPNALLMKEHSPNTERLHSPSIPCGTQYRTVECGPPLCGALGARWVVGVMRVISTFLWMSDPLHYYYYYPPFSFFVSLIVLFTGLRFVLY